MTTTNTVHVFEKAGLGIAPFRFVGVDYRVGPLLVSSQGGVETWVGSPGQPMGTCDFCGQGIAECCTIRDSQGKTFVVGNVCVSKTGDRGLITAVKPEIARLRREAGQKRDDRRIDAANEAVQDPAVRAVLAGRPHPAGWEGKTLLDWVLWMLAHAGRTGKVKAARSAERAVEEVGTKASGGA